MPGKIVSKPHAQDRKSVLTLFGTRPETIKLAPVIHALECYAPALRTLNVTSAQHTDLLYPFVNFFDLRIDENLRVMRRNQTPSQVCSRVLLSLDKILAREKPDLVLVQGDTTTALAGALAAFQRKILVGHVEAGLRSGDEFNPFPEEMNRRLITQLTTYHFAATEHNRATLIAEGANMQDIFVTGNPVVDSLKAILKNLCVSSTIEKLCAQTRGLKRMVLTMHRRESFGAMMHGHFHVLRQFVETEKDVALIFPVHPNPSVGKAAHKILDNHRRIHLIAPLEYQDFIALLSKSWLILSDSGGVQEEAPTLGKPLLILRENTERPEVLETGIARLVGANPVKFAALLADAHKSDSWVEHVKRVANPFGDGASGARIARIVAEKLELNATEQTASEQTMETSQLEIPTRARRIAR